MSGRHEKAVITPDRKLGRALPLAEQVVAALQSDILEGRLREGEKLLTEPALAVAFGVSRTVIREAMARLRNDGLVTSRQGAGVFVAAVSLDRAFRMPPQSLENAQTIKEIFELRLGIEVEAAALAADRRVPDDVARMQRALAAIDTTRDGPDFGVEADVEFHRAIALATGNSKISSFQRYLSVFLVQSIAAARANTRQISVGVAAEVTQEHHAILEAVQAQLPDRARAAMRTHLMNAQGRLGLLAPEFLQRMRRLW